MAIYKQIQTWMKQTHDFVSAMYWIADVKFQSGLPMRKAPNRKGAERVKPCLSGIVKPIRAALRHLG